MARKGENIHKRIDGRWEGRYLVVEPKSGRKMYKSIYAKTYTEVKRKLLIAKSEGFQDSKMVSNSVYSEMWCFEDLAAAWLGSIKNDKKYSTYIKYTSVYETHLRKALGQKKISEIRPDSLKEVYEASNSDSIRKSIYSVFNQISSYACERFQINMEKSNRPKLQKKSNVVTVLSQSEQTALLKNLYHEMDAYKLAILICVSTGLRIGEVCALKWKDIDFQGKLLYINRTVQRLAVKDQKTKTTLFVDEPKSAHSRREIPIPDNLIHLLFLMKNEGEYVITPNKPTEPKTLQNHFRQCLKEAELDGKNFHILRHTFATNCINAGVDVKSLSEILGHASVTITLNRYVHSTIETKRNHMNHLYAIYGHYIGQKCS